MTNEEVTKYVKSLAMQAEAANQADFALKFSQAACNIANAYSALKRTEMDCATLSS